MAPLQRFLVRSPMPVSAEELFAWHARPGAFERLTPPFEPTRLVERSGGLEVGARTVLEVKLGPVWRRWVAVHTACVEGSSFTDTQQSGPFASWEHTHRMLPRGDAESFLEDDVRYALPLGLLGQLGGGHIAGAKLERMFAYRHAVTRADLERHRAHAGAPRLHVLMLGPASDLAATFQAFLTTGGHRVTRLETLAQVQALPAELDAVVHLPEGTLQASHADEVVALGELLGTASRRLQAVVGLSRTAYAKGRKDLPLVEESALGDDAPGRATRAYETSLRAAAAAGKARIALLRRGAMVKGAAGSSRSALAPLRGLARRAAPEGETLPWISKEDLVGLLHQALLRRDFPPVLNAVAPNPMPTAAFLREAGSHVEADVEGFRQLGEVEPSAALGLGFPFLHPELSGALAFFTGTARLANLAGK